MRLELHIALALLCGGCSGSTTDPVPPMLVHVEKPSEPGLGAVSVTEDGSYTYWVPGEGPVHRGNLSAQQLDEVGRATSDTMQAPLWECVAEDYDECRGSVDGYIVKTKRGLACWHYADIESRCGGAEGMVTFHDLLHGAAGKHSG